jgi:diadenylate cyclase
MAKKKETKSKKEPAELWPLEQTQSRIMLESAMELARRIKLQSILLYVDGLDNLAELEPLRYDDIPGMILIAREESAHNEALKYTKKTVRLPDVPLTRMSQIKISVMLSFSNRFISPGDRFVFVTGLTAGPLDTLMVLEVGHEYDMFQSVDQPPITEHIRRAVFERVLSLALELAAEGREGKPIGAIFILGDSTAVSSHSQQNIINPFKGYPENERNVLDPQMMETIKEFSTIDGAFVIKGTGAIVSAGTYLLPRIMVEALPQGLGSRHAAAAAITAATKSIAITISESTGTVRIWRQGCLITEIEKAKRNG